MKQRFREFLESIDPSWEYEETHGDLAADAAEHLAQYDQQQRHIRELQTAVHDLLVTDKPAAWELILGESRYEEIKALNLLEPPR